MCGHNHQHSDFAPGNVRTDQMQFWNDNTTDVARSGLLAFSFGEECCVAVLRIRAGAFVQRMIVLNAWSASEEFQNEVQLQSCN